MWKRRLARAPVSSRSTSSTSTRARPFTGEIEMRATVGMPRRLRVRLDLDLMAFQIEDVKVPPGHVDRHVVDGRGPDRAFEAAAVRVAVDDDVRAVLRDRCREALAAEVRPDSLGLAVES